MQLMVINTKLVEEDLEENTSFIKRRSGVGG